MHPCAETVLTNSKSASDDSAATRRFNGDHGHRPARQTKPPISTTLRDVLRWWIDIWACIIATLAIAAEIWIHLRYNGQPQASWPSTTLTLNGLIALLTTVYRGCLTVPVASVLSQSKWLRFDAKNNKSHKLADYELLDEASRGSYGSLLVLWRFKGLL